MYIIVAFLRIQNCFVCSSVVARQNAIMVFGILEISELEVLKIGILYFPVCIFDCILQRTTFYKSKICEFYKL